MEKKTVGKQKVPWLNTKCLHFKTVDYSWVLYKLSFDEREKNLVYFNCVEAELTEIH